MGEVVHWLKAFAGLQETQVWLPVLATICDSTSMGSNALF